MSTHQRNSIKYILQNVDCPAFKSKYLPLGKKDGKKQYIHDCHSNGVRASTKGLTVIEKGYSHREKVTYENDITRCDYDAGRLGNSSASYANRVSKGKKDGEIDSFGRVISRANPSTVTRETITAEKAKENAMKAKEDAMKAKMEKKAKRKLEKEKEKMANAESWEDVTFNLKLKV